ncbi:MAG TPA: MATE family efflux transporter [Erysipelotrichaceae bacterium]|nr:MATE family efflux transporter [Erysipelotrichaceae bacterium]
MVYHNPLGEEKISKLLIKFSIPAIVGMLVSALYNIVDRIYIGNAPELGANGLAGITIGFPLMLIMLAVGVLFGVGGATLFSIRLGQKREVDAEKVLGNAFVLLVGSGIIYMILGQIFLVPLLQLFGASPTVLPFSIEYMRVIFFGSTFQIVSMGLNHFIRADGSPKIAMMTMFIGAGINIVLDPIFIFGLNMGMMGAALATIIAQGVSAIWVVLHFLGKHSKAKLQVKNLILDSAIVKKVVSLGLPGFLLQLASSLLNTLLNRNLYIYGGDIAVSGMGVINSIQTLMLMPIIGLNQGVQPIISFNFGAKKFDRVKEAIKLAITVATSIVVVGFIITRLFPELLVSMFNRDAELLVFGTMAISSWFMMLPVVGFQIIAANFFQAIGRSKSAMFLTLTRQIIFLIPAVIFFPQFWGVEGLLYAAPFADLLAAILTGYFFINILKDLTHLSIQHKENEFAAESLLEI